MERGRRLPKWCPSRRETGHSRHRARRALVTVVGGIDDDRVVGPSQVVELLQERTDLFVVLDHLGPYDVRLGAAFVDSLLDILLRWMRPDMYRSGVEPDKEGLVALADLV